jgi:hypothetical protein
MTSCGPVNPTRLKSFLEFISIARMIFRRAIMTLSLTERFERGVVVAVWSIYLNSEMEAVKNL